MSKVQYSIFVEIYFHATYFWVQNSISVIGHYWMISVLIAMEEIHEKMNLLG